MHLLLCWLSDADAFSNRESAIYKHPRNYDVFKHIQNLCVCNWLDIFIHSKIPLSHLMNNEFCLRILCLNFMIITTNCTNRLFIPNRTFLARLEFGWAEPCFHVFGLDLVEPKYPRRNQPSLEIPSKLTKKCTIRYLPYPNSAKWPWLPLKPYHFLPGFIS